MLDNLVGKIESILFVAGDAVLISDICSKLDVDKKDVLECVKILQEKHNESSGIELKMFNNKLQLSSNPMYADEVSKVLNPIRQRNLSKATLETIAIIAYKQPITRLEIEEIRKVSSDYALNILLEHGLIEIVGRKDTVGHPTLFGTTDEFLKRFDISSIDELPDYESLLEQIKVIRSSSDDRLYNHFEVSEEENIEKKIDVAVSKIEDRVVEEILNQNENEDSVNKPDESIDDGNDYFCDEFNDNNDYFKNSEDDYL